MHIEKAKAEEVLRGAATKLNQGGYLYIAVKEKSSNGIDEETKTDDDYGYEYQRFFSYYSIDELKQYLENIGLEVVFTETNPPSRTARASNWISIIGKKK